MIRKDLFREIKKTKSRFISVVLLVVLAVSFLYGLRISAPDMQASMDAYLDDQGMFDIQVLSTLGLTEDDVSAIADAEGIAKAEGSYTVDAIASTGDATMIVKGISISEQGINMPYLSEGRLPEKPSECLVEKKFVDNIGLKLGDTVTLDCGTGSFEDALTVTEFTVVGIAENPLYTSISRGTSTLGNGSVGAIVMLPSEAYALDYYTEINAVVKDTVALNAYSNEYESIVERSVSAIETIQPHREKARTDEIIGEARDELDDGWKEYYEGEADAHRELNSAKAELDDAALEIEENKKSIQDGLAAVESGYKELDSAAEEIETQREELAKGREEYELGRKEYESALLEWQQGKAALDAARQQMLDNGMTEAMADAALAESYAELNAGKATLDAVKAELDATPGKLEQGEKALADAAAQIEAQRAELEKAETSLLEGEQELLLGEEEYQKGLSQYYSGKAEAETELAEARADLNEAEEEIADIESAEWYVLDRGSNMGFAGYEQDAERMDRLADVIPIVFFLV
ncbi:MAG: ABC transporter permease, partial [Firmicutes bacterium]|nr:ABC transporter permease [Bacillota bacterium]